MARWSWRRNAVSLDIVQNIEIPNSPFVSPIRSVRPDAPRISEMSDVGRYVQRIFNTAKAYRKKVDANWDNYYDAYRGRFNWWRSYNQYKDNWRTRLTVNHTFATCQNIVAVLFDNKPRIDIRATSWRQNPYAQTLQIAVDQIWSRRRLGSKSEDAMLNGCIYGNGYLKIYWNPDAENGQGDVDGEVVPTQYLFADPRATDIEDAEYIIEAKPVPVAYVHEMYGERGKLVHADAPQGSYAESRAQRSTLRGLEVFGGMDSGSVRFSTPVGAVPSLSGQYDPAAPQAFDGKTSDKWVTLIEAWVRDRREETYEIDVLMPGPQGMQWGKQPMKRPMYPYGRLITMAGNIVLRDIPSPYRRWPYVRFVDVRLPAEFYGVGEPEVLRDLQFEINKRRSQMVDHAAHMGNAIWIIDKNSMVDPDMLTNRPGQVVDKVGGTEVTRLPPPAMPSWLPAMYTTAVGEVHEISGMSAMPGGLPPRGIRSGSGFEAVANITNTRVRSRGRNVEYAVESIGRIIVSLIQDNYTYPRMVRVLGAAGNVWFVPFDGRTVRGDWDIVVEPGSMMPVTRAVRAQQAIELYRMQAIDRRALLEATGFPGAEEVLQRMGEVSTYPNQNYVGQPGMRNPDSSDVSSYAATVRGAPAVMQLPQGPAMQTGPSQGPPQ